MNRVFHATARLQGIRRRRSNWDSPFATGAQDPPGKREKSVGELSGINLGAGANVLTLEANSKIFIVYSVYMVFIDTIFVHWYTETVPIISVFEQYLSQIMQCLDEPLMRAKIQTTSEYYTPKTFDYILRVSSPIVIKVPTRDPLAVKTKSSFVSWLAKLQ